MGKPPLKWRIGAALAGKETQTMLSKFWEWANGKKTLVGGIVTLIAFAPQIAATLTSFGVDPDLTLKIVGGATVAVGVAHKVYKSLYGEEHP